MIKGIQGTGVLIYTDTYSYLYVKNIYYDPKRNLDKDHYCNRVSNFL